MIFLSLCLTSLSLTRMARHLTFMESLRSAPNQSLALEWPHQYLEVRVQTLSWHQPKPLTTYSKSFCNVTPTNYMIPKRKYAKIALRRKPLHFHSLQTNAWPVKRPKVLEQLHTKSTSSIAIAKNQNQRNQRSHKRQFRKWLRNQVSGKGSETLPSQRSRIQRMSIYGSLSG